jgi:hypothetical protein
VATAAVRFLSTRVNSKLKKQQVAIHKVFLLPPLLQFNRLGMKGAEGMTPESDRLAATVSSVLTSEFTQRGVEVLSNPAPAEDAGNAIAGLQAKYDNVSVQLRRKPYGVDDGRYTLGDGVAVFTPAKGADAIVAVRGAALQATEAKSIAIIVGMGAVSSFRGDIAFIDAHTGEILAWTQFGKMGDMSQNPADRLVATMRNALRLIPLPLPPK